MSSQKVNKVKQFSATVIPSKSVHSEINIKNTKKSASSLPSSSTATTLKLFKSSTQPNKFRHLSKSINGLQIVKLADKESHCEDVDITKKVNPGCVYIVFLPQLLTERFSPIKLPILMHIHEIDLSRSGFQLPFSEYFDNISNFFEIEINRFKLHGQIMACEADPISLKITLEGNIKKNPTWRGCMKMIGSSELFYSITHKPLIDILAHHEMFTDQELNEFMEQVKGEILFQKSNNLEQKDDLSSDVDRSETEVEAIEDDIIFSSQNQNLEYGDRRKESQDLSSKKRIKEMQACEIDGNMVADKDNVKLKIDFLHSRKNLLSHLDINGTTIIDLIQVVSDLYKMIAEKDQFEDQKIICIKQEDKTYKIKAKNRILLEGKIEFELDKYKDAVCQAKVGNPFSLAYQMVRVCFPSQYVTHIGLGKKFYDSKEVEKILESIKTKDFSTKIPLAVALGFNHPIEEPFEGNFDLVRGQERVKALIEHLLRKSKIFKYDYALENKIRASLSKQISARNRIEKVVIPQQNEIEISENESNDVFDYNLFS